MSTIFKRPNSPFWFACYSDRNGKTVKRSTKSTDRPTASRMALEWERVEKTAKEGHASVATFQKVVTEISEQVIGESLPSQTVREYLEEWLASIVRKNSAGTLERYRNTVRLFLKSIEKMADQPLRSLTPRHIELFLNRRLDSGVAPKTAIIDVKSLSVAFHRAERYGYIEKNPVDPVKLPKSVSSEREVFSLEEIHLLVKAAPNEDWQTFILLGAFTGARLGDCLRMTWDNLVPEHKVIAYEQQKTGKTVVLPVHADLLAHLQRLSEGGTVGPLCRSLAAKNQAGKHGLSEGFKKVVERAGLDVMLVKGKGTRNFSKRTFHSLRHTFSSLLAGNGVSEEMRMRLTGHSSRDIHQKYTHMNTELLQRAIDSIPAFPCRTNRRSHDEGSSTSVQIWAS
jgi:integrase